MTRLVLQHCVMPTYQFFIQVQPDQATVIYTYQTVVFVVEQQPDRREGKRCIFPHVSQMLAMVQQSVLG